MKVQTSAKVVQFNVFIYESCHTIFTINIICVFNIAMLLLTAFIFENKVLFVNREQKGSMSNLTLHCPSPYFTFSSSPDYHLFTLTFPSNLIRSIHTFFRGLELLPLAVLWSLQQTSDLGSFRP